MAHAIWARVSPRVHIAWDRLVARPTVTPLFGETTAVTLVGHIGVAVVAICIAATIAETEAIPVFIDALARHRDIGIDRGISNVARLLHVADDEHEVITQIVTNVAAGVERHHH
ncbi:MAG: hypothetical protein JNK72_15775 [Myxococcales bacterium]|nr:hypothetical protein [Myxococcales bacterium]